MLKLKRFFVASIVKQLNCRKEKPYWTSVQSVQLPCLHVSTQKHRKSLMLCLVMMVSTYALARRLSTNPWNEQLINYTVKTYVKKIINIYLRHISGETGSQRCNGVGEICQMEIRYSRAIYLSHKNRVLLKNILT